MKGFVLIYPIEIFIVLRERMKSTARTIPVMMAITPRARPACSVELIFLVVEVTTQNSELTS